MRISKVIWIGAAALAAALWGSGSAWAQNDPSLTGSSSAKSSSAVSSLTLTAPSGLFPGNLMLANLTQSYLPSVVSLTSVANDAPFGVAGTVPLGNAMGSGYAFATNLVGTSLTWNGVTYPLCGANTLCAVTSGVTVNVTAGNYTTLNMVASSSYNPGVNTFYVTYTDGSTTTFSQGFADWGAGATYSNETNVLTTGYRITNTGAAGSAQNWYIYGYQFALNPAKTLQSITVPNTPNIVVMGMSLAVSNVAASAPSGWSTLSTTNTGAMSQSVFYRVATSADVAGSTTYAFTFPTSGLAAGSIMAFGGVATSSPVVTASSQTNAASTTYTAPSVSWQSTQTWVGLYSVANGTTSGSDFSAIASTSATIDAGTGSGTSGVLIGGFEYGVSSHCASSCTSGAFTTTASTSAVSIGTSILLNGALPSPSALWHLDEASWSGKSGEVVDSSGNGYNGVAVHGATTSDTTPAISGTPGTCYYGAFNGTSQYVQLPSTLPHVGGNFTVTAWIYPTAANGAPTYSGYNGARIFWDNYNNNGYALSYGDQGNQRLHFYSPNLGAVNSQVSLALNTWYFVTAEVASTGSTYTLTVSTFSAGGTLLDQQSVTESGTWSSGTGPYATIGGNADSSGEGAYFHFPGSIDEVAIYDAALTPSQLTGLVLATHPCVSYAPDHYAVSAASSAVNCQATPVTIAAHTSTHAAYATTETITITTNTGHGDWTLTTGSGTFVAGTSNSGSATYTFVQADLGSVVLSLRDTYAETVTINVTDGTATAKSGSALASEDSPITFAASGFRITNGSNVATTIGTQKAGVASSATQTLALQAVRTDTATGACTNLFPLNTQVSVNLAFQCNNPTSCVSGQTFSVTNNGTTTNLAANPNSAVSNYTSVPLKFTTANGEAPITLTYSDAGQISLAANYNIPLGNGNASANNLTGSFQFVVQPYSLTLSNIKVTSSGAANPGASTASGTVFTAAGQAFSSTVTATNAQGSATPNFGRETSPASVTLTPALVLPVSGHNPAVSGSFGTYSSGAATGTAFSWPEVGIITLTPSVASYLGSGTVTGTTSGNVGRFIPNAFSTAVNTPVFGTACSAGSFGYVGQPFTYTVAPVITTTALAVGGATTQNYTGALMRLTNSSLTNKTYTPTPASPTLTLTGLPATDPVIADLGGSSGQATLTFSAGSGINFTRGSAIAPFTANIALSINVIDADGVTASNPVTFGASSGIAFSTSATQYYGRLFLRDSVGSELLDLPMPLTTQYYQSTTQGFVTNTNDVCTTAPAITFSNYVSPLATGETCVRDSGSPGASGQGCATAASSRYSATASTGNFNLILAAPGSGNTGALTVTATAPTWLQYPWNASCGSTSNPCALGTFGLFPGSATRVYQRETY
jgi:MSHA biogenesis protein MshQ